MDPAFLIRGHIRPAVAGKLQTCVPQRPVALWLLFQSPAMRSEQLCGSHFESFSALCEDLPGAGYGQKDLLPADCKTVACSSEVRNSSKVTFFVLSPKQDLRFKRCVRSDFGAILTTQGQLFEALRRTQWSSLRIKGRVLFAKCRHRARTLC